MLLGYSLEFFSNINLMFYFLTVSLRFYTSTIVVVIFTRNVASFYQLNFYSLNLVLKQNIIIATLPPPMFWYVTSETGRVVVIIHVCFSVNLRWNG